MEKIIHPSRNHNESSLDAYTFKVAENFEITSST